MAKKPRLYTRLTRATSSVGSYRSLWMGADHLLVVTSTGYTEEYRRILFQNIQGFFTIRSERRTYWAIFWIIIAGLSGIFMTATLTGGGTPIASLIFLVIGTVGAIWNYLLGPSCKVYVLTGVQTLQLPSMVRKRKARKVLAKIVPLIAEAQRELPVATLSASAIAEPPPLPLP